MKQKLHHQLPSTPLESKGKHAVKMEEEIILPGSQHSSKHAPSIALGLASSSQGQKWKRSSPARKQRCLETSLEKVESNLGGGWGVFVALCVKLGQESGRNTEVLSRRLAGYRP